MKKIDETIDRLMKEREQAQKLGHRQNERDSLLLLALLLEDVKRNPARYANP